MNRIVRKALVKYHCTDIPDCGREFVVQEPSADKWGEMTCPFCQEHAEACVGPDPDAQELYDQMGCFYPSRWD